MFRTFGLVAAAFALVVGLLVAWGRESRRDRSAGKGPDRAGNRTERCVTCHAKDTEDPGGAHARAALGCSPCHLGNPLAFEKERAHEGLEREPGALSTVSLTCGREGCHAREAASLPSSPMVRAAGIVAVDRFAFGELPTPDGAASIAEVLAAARPTDAESHLRKLCAGCHLGTRRANRDDAIRGNGSGCAACHVPLRQSGDPPRAHPPVDARVPDDRCLGCHSRSGRISLSYQGLAEIEPHQAGGVRAACAAPVALHDGRPACRVAPDVHQAAGMSCTDCHLHTEMMGDAVARTHKEEQTEVTCEACHGPVPEGGERLWGDLHDPVTRDLLRIRHEDRAGTEPVRVGRRGTPLWNLRPAPSGWALTRKLDGRVLRVKQTPADRNHALKGHERLTCSACHAAWAPTCTTCHTRLDREGRQWDFAAAKETEGAWIETSEGYSWAPPLLGVRADGRIVPAVPGMILEIDASAAAGKRSARRLLSPLEPHTTGRKARTCESCHRAPPAPAFEAGTRTGLRGLNTTEARRVTSARLDDRRR